MKHAQHPNDPDPRSDGAILDALRTAGVLRPNFRPDEVQAKRWSHSVPGRIVRELRGAPRVDERGLIVTTAEFTPEAIREAAAEGKPRSACPEATHWSGPAPNAASAPTACRQ